jgi:hypothetical protein
LQKNTPEKGDKRPFIETKRINTKESRVLFALAEATEFTLKAHVPKHAIFSQFRRDERGIVGHDIKGLVRKGLAVRHPTRGETTLCLSREGLTLCRQLSNE